MLHLKTKEDINRRITVLFAYAFLSLFVVYTTALSQPGNKKDYEYTDKSVEFLIEELAKPQCQTIIFDDSVKDFVSKTNSDFSMKETTSVNALMSLFRLHNLKYEYGRDNKLIVYRGELPKTFNSNLHIIKYWGVLESVAQLYAQKSNLKLFMDESIQKLFKTKVAKYNAQDVSTRRAMQEILASVKLTYEHISCSEIVILKL